jgi:AcrR family transcriptional regulator
LQEKVMSKRRLKPAPRKPRADAQRNRERLLEVAKSAFARSGADVSLDDIAKRARVGPGTLYRHFPTRDSLLEAVYRTEVEKLANAQQEYATNMSPVEALRAWMFLFVDYIATKQLIAAALNSLITDACELYESSKPRIVSAMNALVARAIKSGEIRPDIDPFDFLRALVGVSNVASAPNWPQSAKKLVDILIAGSRNASEPAARKGNKRTKA